MNAEVGGRDWEEVWRRVRKYHFAYLESSLT